MSGVENSFCFIKVYTYFIALSYGLAIMISSTREREYALHVINKRKDVRYERKVTAVYVWTVWN